MAKQNINIGANANDGTGDTVRVAFDKTNQNFTEIYGNPLIGATSGTVPSSTHTGTPGQVMYDSNYIYVCIATNSWVRAAITSSF
jgi:hypothetical protein